MIRCSVLGGGCFWSGLQKKKKLYFFLKSLDDHINMEKKKKKTKENKQNNLSTDLYCYTVSEVFTYPDVFFLI